jgi:hypothetical protein
MLGSRHFKDYPLELPLLVDRRVPVADTRERSRFEWRIHQEMIVYPPSLQ